MKCRLCHPVSGQRSCATPVPDCRNAGERNNRTGCYMGDVHCFGVRDLKEYSALRLQLHKLSLREFCSSYPNRIALLQSQGLHHPVGEMHTAFLRDELQHTRVRRSSWVLRIAQLEHPRRLYVHLRDACEGRWWHDDYMRVSRTYRSIAADCTDVLLPP